MVKQPYIHVYPGDDLKEMRHLSLEESGAYWKLKYSLHECEGKLTASWSDVFRIIGANSVDHTKRVLSKLQAKNIFQISTIKSDPDPEDEILQILYQPYIDKAALSIKRAAAGSKGGEISSKNKSKSQPNLTAKSKQKRDYDYDSDNDNDNNSGLKGGMGEKWNPMPGEGEKGIQLTPDEITNSVEYIFYSTKSNLSAVQINDFWKAFVIQAFDGQTHYPSRTKAITHFRNWLKSNYGNSNASSRNSKARAGADITNLQGLKRGAEESLGRDSCTTGVDGLGESAEWTTAEVINS